MKAHKYSLPKFTPRLTAFLLFLSMLLTVFPSYAHAVMPEGEQTDQNSTATQQENVPLQEPIDTQLNTELESSLAEAASVALVVSEPVINNTANTNIMLSNNKVDIEPNETQLLRVQTSLSNVTSISLEVDNPSVLDLGTPGSLLYGEVYVSVIGNNTGIATVTAKVKNGDTVLDTVSIEIYVTMDDGIYLIKNGESHLEGDYYLRPDKLPTAVDPAPPVYGSTNNYWMLENDLFRYYRIQYYGNGKYVIRPLANETYALSLVNGAVSLSSDISDMSLWILQTHGSSYRIIHAGSQNGDGLVFPVGYPLSAIYNNVFLYQYGIPTVRDYDNMAFENWSLIPATVTGIVFRNEKEGTLCSTFSATADLEYGGVYISDFGYKVLAFSGTTTPTLTWSCQQNPGNANIGNSATGRIVLHNVGTSVLSVGFTVGEVVHAISFTLNVFEQLNAIRSETTYYIMNHQSKKYMSIANETEADFTNVKALTRSTSLISQWKLTKQVDGQYQIVNKYGSANKVLNATSTNLNVCTNTRSNTQFFSIERIDTVGDAYRGLYYIRYGEYYVAQDDNFNVFLSSNCNGANKVWSISAVEKGNAYLYDFDCYGNGKIHTAEYGELFTDIFDAAGYQTQEFTNSSATTAYESMELPSDDHLTGESPNIFIFIGHGSVSKLAFFDSDGNNAGYISVKSSAYSGSEYCFVDDLSNNELANMRCVLYLGCKTGLDTSDGLNLLEATYEKGAHFVLGTLQKVTIAHTLKFLNIFLTSIQSGMSICQSIEEAIDAIGLVYYEDLPHGIPYPVVFCGDTSQYLN